MHNNSTLNSLFSPLGFKSGEKRVHDIYRLPSLYIVIVIVKIIVKKSPEIEWKQNTKNKITYNNT